MNKKTTADSNTREPASLKFEWERRFRDHGQPVCLAAVGYTLSTFAQSTTGKAWPSVKTLAHALLLSERMVQRSLAQLEADGWITRILGGGTQSTTYYLTIPNDPPTKSRKTRVKSTVDAPTLEVAGDTDVTGAIGVTGDTDDTRVVTLVSSTGDTEVTQSSSEQPSNQSPLREPSSSRPPKGVSIAKWDAVGPILNEVLRSLGSDSPRFIADWEQLTGKAALAEGIYTMLRHGNSPRVVTELLVEDGYAGIDHPARALYVRVKDYQERRLAAIPAVGTTTNNPAADSQGEVAVADAIALLTKSWIMEAPSRDAANVTQLSGDRDAR